MKQSKRIAATGVWLLFQLTRSATAWAGCPNLCEGTAHSVEATPPLACAKVEDVLFDDCFCVVQFDVSLMSDCASLQALDFSFNTCSSPRDGVCAEISPGTNGSMRVALGDVGIARKTLKVRDEAGEHEIVVEAEVKDFIDGCGCSREPSDTSTAAAMGGLLLAFCGVTAGRRKRLF